VRELRPVAALHDRASLETLVGATLTAHHPPGKILTADNWRAHAVGVVHQVRIDGDRVVGVLHVHDQATVDAIMRGELHELSPGYMVALDTTPGIDPDYGAYDASTTAIRYNHISLLPPGGGRQGSEVCLRLDANGIPVVDYRIRNDMDPEAIKAMIAEQMPDLEALQGDVAAKVAEQVSAMLPDMIAAAVQEALGAAKAEEPAAEPEQELVADADPMAPPAPEDERPLEERTDARVIETIRTVERVLGAPADLRLSLRALLQAAAKHAGLDMRADASQDRLLGALEAHGASTWRRVDSAPAPVADTLTMDAYNRRVAAERAGR
jgi:hypothetical protein